MSIEWQDELTTGIAEIDAQHKELFARFNAFLACCNEGRGKDEVLRLLAFLDDYIRSHFASEERMQAKQAYHGYYDHREEHRSFILEVERLKARFAEEGASLPLVILTNKTLASWLVQHISKTDRAFAEFLQR